MKVLISGGSGMVGKNLLTALKKQGIHTLLAPSSKELNLLDSTKTNNYLQEHKPDLVIHCAGTVGGIQANIKNPVNFLVNNTQMGINLITAAREAGVKKLLNLGSSCMYPKGAPNPLKEELILKGELEPTNEGYALAKITCARLCEYINREDSSFEYKTIIPCNLYGAHDSFDPANSHLIPAIIHKVHEAKKGNSVSVEIWGTGNVRREFMSVDDLIHFISFALENFSALPTYLNVGTGVDYSINEYYQTVAKVIGWEGEFTHDLDRPEGMKQKLVDTTLLEKTGWKSSLTLEEGIQNAYNYYQSIL
jgi:GDP-L-fucose synthase